MTEDEQYIAKKLADLVLQGGSASARFIGDMELTAMESPNTVLTTSQTEHLFMLLYTYRERLPETYAKYKDNPLCKARYEQKPKQTYEQYLESLKSKENGG